MGQIKERDMVKAMQEVGDFCSNVLDESKQGQDGSYQESLAVVPDLR